MSNNFSLGTMNALAQTSRELRSLSLNQLDKLLRAETNSYFQTFAPSSYIDIDAFFDEAYADYDTGLQNPYWRFSDDILKHLMLHEIASTFKFHSRLNVLDAGAGTGNWSRFIKDELPSSKIVLFDRNTRMLSKARAKFTSFERRDLRFIEGDLEHLHLYLNESFDVVICFHNVIGMARNTNLLLVQLFKVLRQGGLGLIMAPNLYHAMIFLLEQNNTLEFHKTLHTGTVKFKRDMPEMFCFTPDSLKRAIVNSGFKSCKVLGFPVTVFPEQSDSFLKVYKTTQHFLANRREREALLSMEKRLCKKEEYAYRAGTSLFAACGT